MIILAGIFVYILSTIFRMLDTSAFVLIAHGISVTPFYLSKETILDKMKDITDEEVLRKLRRNLFYKKAATFCIYLAIALVIIGIPYEIYDPTVWNLLVG